jgi:transcriptional regulator
MYVPEHFEPKDENALWDLIDEHPFGTLLTIAGEQPFATHVPFLADRAARMLHCHVARANPQWRDVERAAAVLAIFTGPHGYISPTWYAQPGGVPTRNYAVVHAHGKARSVDDPAEKARHVELLAAKFERGSATPWVPDYDRRRLEGIVGIALRVARLEGKLKLSQNRPAADRQAVAAALEARGREADVALAHAMRAVGPSS